MIYYIGLLGYVFLVYGLSNIIKNEKLSKISFCFFSCLGVVLFQGFRSYSVGVDLSAYVPDFVSIGQAKLNDIFMINDHYEHGYVLLNKILYECGLNERGFLIVIAILIQVPIFITICTYSEKPLLSILYYFAFGEFLFTFSGLRQAIAMSICFISYYFIKERKLIFFILLVILASFFHTAALACLVIYPLYYLKMNNVMYIISLVIITILFIFKWNIYSIASNLLFPYYPPVKTGAYTMYIIYLCIYISSLIFIKFKKNEDKDIIGLLNILFTVVCIYSFAPVSTNFTRLAFPFELYLTLYFPKLFSLLNVKKWIYNLLLILSYIFLSLCFLHFVGSLNTLPFSFF